MNSSTDNVCFRYPKATDGAALNALVAACPPLDGNSLYCNLLQCTHFAHTSVAAEKGGELCGFVSGYLQPEAPDTLFVWQVAVSSEARGQNLATRMLQSLLARPECAGVCWLETTVTNDNAASWALFEGLSEKLGTRLSRELAFDTDRHFRGAHDSEWLARIGPLPESRTAAGTLLTRSAANA